MVLLKFFKRIFLWSTAGPSSLWAPLVVPIFLKALELPSMEAPTHMEPIQPRGGTALTRAALGTPAWSSFRSLSATLERREPARQERIPEDVGLDVLPMLGDAPKDHPPNP